MMNLAGLLSHTIGLGVLGAYAPLPVTLGVMFVAMGLILYIEDNKRVLTGDTNG